MSTHATILRDITIAAVRADGPDLSQRQMAVLLTTYGTLEPQTVRGLAAMLDVSKPAITRALDRLSELGLVGRTVDPLDRRSIHVSRTDRGRLYYRWLDGQVRVAMAGSMKQDRESDHTRVKRNRRIWENGAAANAALAAQAARQDGG